jgi:P27 family predicted phage terminase small subunit
MKGRKPEPTSVLRARGTLRPHRRKNEPKLVASRPEPPAILRNEAREEWDRITAAMEQMQILEQASGAVIAAYCLCWQDLWEARRGIENNGDRIENSQGQRQSIDVDRYEAAKTGLLRFASELGLTPVSRTKVRVEPKPHPLGGPLLNVKVR